MSEALVKIDNVSKKFCKDLKTGLWYGVKDLTSNLFSNKINQTLRPKEFWAVDNISFEVKRGECLGLLGHNGAGKSTLLKVINGLIAPDKGRIEMRGRVNALIELGAGFNPILTGRENIFNNAAIMGISRAETQRKLEEIIAFSELEEFIDTPVQYYSSGMKVKLGFAVAAHTDPDILILDEVLAVGDAGFRIKSFNKMMEMMKSCAVLFVSHSMPNVARVCNKVIYMEHGKNLYCGEDVHKGIEMYFDQFASETSEIEFNEGADITEIKVNNTVQIGAEKILVNYGEDLKLELDITIKDNIAEEFYIALQIVDKDLKIVANYFTNKFNGNFRTEKENHIVITFPELLLIDGDYQITYFIATTQGDNGQYRYLGIYRNYTSIKVRGLKENVYAAIFLKGNVTHNGKSLSWK